MKFTTSRICSILAATLLATMAAQAHAILLKSEPMPNAVLHNGTLHITLHFNSRVDGKRSQFTLISADGTERVPLTAQKEPDTLSADVQAKSGTHKLLWQVLAADGHITRGQIPFSVLPSGK